MGAQIIPVPLDHGGLRVLGFRVGGAAYLTDFSRLPEESKPLLTGLDDLILDALRDTPHPMHLTVEQALESCARSGSETRVVHAHFARFGSRGN